MNLLLPRLLCTHTHAECIDKDRYHSFTYIYNGSCDNQLTVSYHLRAAQSVSSAGIYDHSCAQAPLQMKEALVSLWYASQAVSLSVHWSS